MVFSVFSRAAEVKSWTWCWPSLERGLSSEVRRRPKAHRGYSQVPLFLPHVHRSFPRPPSPPTRKQLASVIRRCTYFHHFISSALFVCFSIMTKVLCPLVTARLITITSDLGAKEGKREKESERGLMFITTGSWITDAKTMKSSKQLCK